MRNVALSSRPARVHEKSRFGSAVIRSPVPVNTRHRTALIWPGATRHGFTMENVALNHEKCRYCLFSSGNQERKRNNIKERTIRRREDRRRILVIPRKESKHKRDFLLSVFQVLNSSSPPPRRRDVMRRGRQSLRNHILDKGYLAQAMELLQTRQSSLQLHILVKRQISDPILFLRLSHKPPSNTCFLPDLLGNMTIQQETQNQAFIQPVAGKTKMGHTRKNILANRHAPLFRSCRDPKIPHLRFKLIKYDLNSWTCHIGGWEDSITRPVLPRAEVTRRWR